MTPERLFSIVNLVALLSWIVLLAWPRRQRLPHLLAGAIVPAILATVYLAIIATLWPSAEGGFASLRDVATLFANPWLLLAGWTHYLAFDLLVGSWEARDALERGIPRVLLVPCLLLTFLFGPIGWLMYLAVRTRYAAPPMGARAHALS